MVKTYFRPIVQQDGLRPEDAVSVAGGALWFNRAEKITRNQRSVVMASDIPAAVLEKISGKRAPICGLSMDRPRLMGILNVTPDSFSDGGRFEGDAAVQKASRMCADGADIVDIGGESTRPGAEFVPEDVETGRVLPAISAIAEKRIVSIDTRKASVARAAVSAGARLINDVSALEFDPEMLAIAQESGAAFCLMHASGDPKTMQSRLGYDDVVLDVYDYLERRLQYCEQNGIPRQKIAVDPGIGFGKTREHNLALIRNISLFHGLGCVILLGVSRKRFIGTISGEEQADKRAPGSIALGLEGLRQGVQILRVHDIRKTRQAVDLWQAVNFD